MSEGASAPALCHSLASQHCGLSGSAEQKGTLIQWYLLSWCVSTSLYRSLLSILLQKLHGHETWEPQYGYSSCGNFFYNFRNVLDINMYKEYLLDTGNTDSVLDYFQRDDVYWEKEKNPKNWKTHFCPWHMEENKWHETGVSNST